MIATGTLLNICLHPYGTASNSFHKPIITNERSLKHSCVRAKRRSQMIAVGKVALDQHGIPNRAIVSTYFIMTPLTNFVTGASSMHEAERCLGVQMMTSSNGNIFHVTCPLRGEFTGHRWIPRTKASDAGFDVFYLCLNKRVSKQAGGWWSETPSCSLWRHCNAISSHFLSCRTYLLSGCEIIPTNMGRIGQIPTKQSSTHISWCVLYISTNMLIFFSVPSHYPNQCYLFLKGTTRNHICLFSQKNLVRGWSNIWLFCPIGDHIIHRGRLLLRTQIISMAYSKPAVSPLLTHWRSCRFALSHPFSLFVFLTHGWPMLCLHM